MIHEIQCVRQIKLLGHNLQTIHAVRRWLSIDDEKQLQNISDSERSLAHKLSFKVDSINFDNFDQIWREN